MAAFSRIHPSLGLILAAVLALGGLALSPLPARAASIDVTCLGTETAAYSPGLLLTTQTVQVIVNGILAPCTSSDPGITAGSYLETFSANLSCATLLSPRALTRVLMWSNGQASVVSFNRAINNVGGQVTVTFTGAVASGEFAGDTAVEQVVFATPDALQCLAPPGLTQIGPGVAAISLTGP